MTAKQEAEITALVEKIVGDMLGGLLTRLDLLEAERPSHSHARVVVLDDPHHPARSVPPGFVKRHLVTGQR